MPATNLKKAHILRKAEGVTKLPPCRRPSAPGKITQRSCAYYGARWMLAPLKDAIHLVHGPVGCAYYGSTVRGKTYKLFSTALREKDVIFGGGEKLTRSLIETKCLMPKARHVFVYITCSTALIGDDVYDICKKMEKKLGCPVIVVNCPGFKGESQASGHRIAYECLLNQLIGQEKRLIGPNAVNIIGEYNINGETQVIKSLLKKMGINVHCVFTGDAPYERIITAHEVKLNLLICQSTGRFLAQEMERRYGIPHLKVSFFGLSQTKASLHKIGQYLGLKKEAEKVIADEEKTIKPTLSYFLSKLKGKKAALFFGASRMASMINALEDLCMEVIATGSQFGDTAAYMETKQAVKSGTLIMDDASEQDLENMLHGLKPDVFMGGIKEQYLSHKAGIGFCIFPQIKRAGPYVGFKGFLNFARSVYKAVYAPVWRLIKSS